MRTERARGIAHRVLVLIVGLTLAAAGCGGDEGGGDPEPGGPLTAEAWSERVSGLCEENERRATEAARDLRKAGEAEGLDENEFTARLLDVSVETTRPLLRELEALPDPEGRERQAQRFTKLLRDTLPVFTRLAKAVRANDERALEAQNDRILKLATESRRLARELDIAACIPNGSR
jgi:hypothetical protein